ncbi:hypothetical protein [Actinomadura macra]|uniref:hypothetical protein n=1 Tax=Actinomadura macra TaxID=46164 RepID=UPI0012FC5642|nr:hypothetical protein [Actinomadura macra]
MTGTDHHVRDIPLHIDDFGRDCHLAFHEALLPVMVHLQPEDIQQPPQRRLGK